MAYVHMWHSYLEFSLCGLVEICAVLIIRTNELNIQFIYHIQYIIFSVCNNNWESRGLRELWVVPTCTRMHCTAGSWSELDIGQWNELLQFELKVSLALTALSRSLWFFSDTSCITVCVTVWLSCLWKKNRFYSCFSVNEACTDHIYYLH